MVTQLKSYLLQSTELQSMLEPQHQYTQDKLGNLFHFLQMHYAPMSSAHQYINSRISQNALINSAEDPGCVK